jgi:ADP-glucose pyrophosphorylase
LEQGVTVADSVLMPGVRIGKGARLWRTIVEEGVHIPAGFQVGFDLEEDRNHHTVTDAGVVVVSRTPTISKPAVLRFAVRSAHTSAATAMEHNKGIRVTA